MDIQLQSAAPIKLIRYVIAFISLHHCAVLISNLRGIKTNAAKFRCKRINVSLTTV